MDRPLFPMHERDKLLGSRRCPRPQHNKRGDSFALARVRHANHDGRGHRGMRGEAKRRLAAVLLDQLDLVWRQTKAAGFSSRCGRDRSWSSRLSLRKGPVAGEKRSSESEDYASKVRATTLSWLRGRVWVGDVQLACCAFRSMAAFSPRRRNNPEARPARPQRRGPSRRDTAPTDRPAMGRHRGPDWPPADCWHRCGRGTQSRRRSRKTRRGCRAWWRSRAPAGSRQVFCNSNTGLTAAFQDDRASRRSIQVETCGTCSRDMFEPFR